MQHNVDVKTNDMENLNMHYLILLIIISEVSDQSLMAECKIFIAYFKIKSKIKKIILLFVTCNIKLPYKIVSSSTCIVRILTVQCFL